MKVDATPASAVTTTPPPDPTKSTSPAHAASIGTTHAPFAPGIIRSTCPHYTEALVTKAVNRLLHPENSAMRQKAACAACRSAAGPLLACLQCGLLACCSTSNLVSAEKVDRTHLEEHLEGAGHGHIVIDILDSGIVFCSACRRPLWNHYLHRRLTNPDAPPFASRRAATLSSEHKAHCVALRGLMNLGHTCFMNAVLQVLLHVPPLQHAFFGLRHPAHYSEITSSPKTTREGCLTGEMARLYADMFSGAIEPLAPTTFLTELWRSRSTLAGYEQQDAHEFFIAAMDAVHECLPNPDTGTPNSTRGKQKGGRACACIVHDIFGGELRSEVRCLRCSRQTTSVDPFTDISLDISTGEDAVVDLRDCLHAFCRIEKLANKEYLCSGCRSYQSATKKFSFHRLPQCIAIHLKRFEHRRVTDHRHHADESHSTGQKIDRHVCFATEMPASAFTHDTPPLPSSSKNHLVYRLVGVIVHTGGMEGGHYIAYVTHRSWWFRMDDAMVSRVDGSEVLDSKAYMLFYVLK